MCSTTSNAPAAPITPAGRFASSSVAHITSWTPRRRALTASAPPVPPGLPDSRHSAPPSTQTHFLHRYRKACRKADSASLLQAGNGCGAGTRKNHLRFGNRFRCPLRDMRWVIAKMRPRYCGPVEIEPLVRSCPYWVPRALRGGPLTAHFMPAAIDGVIVRDKTDILSPAEGRPRSNKLSRSPWWIDLASEPLLLRYDFVHQLDLIPRAFRRPSSGVSKNDQQTCAVANSRPAVICRASHALAVGPRHDQWSQRPANDDVAEARSFRRKLPRPPSPLF